VFSYIEALRHHFGADDLLFFNRAVTGAFFNLLQFFHHVHAADDLAEDGVFHMEPGSGYGCDEELAAVGAGAGVGHGEQAGLVEGEIARTLICEGFTPDRLAAHARPGGVATLDHELFDDAVKDDAVVIPVVNMGSEIFAGLGCNIVEEFEFDAALSGF